MLAASIVALALAASPASSPAAARGLADFDQLKRELERTYSNLAWMGSTESGFDLVRLNARTYAALRAARSDEDARRALRDFVTSLHDGHFSELPTLAVPSDGAAPVEPPQVTLVPEDPVGGCAALGFAPPIAVAFSLPFESLPNVHLLSDGLDEPFRLALATHADGVRVGLVRIPAFRARSSPAACLSGWARIRAAGQPLTAVGVRAAAQEAWFDALADDLHRLHELGAETVVVDVGNNTGGDDSGDWAVRLFTEREVQSAPLLVSSAPAGAAYFDEELADLRQAASAAPDPALSMATAAFEAGRAALQADRCDLSWVWRERRMWPRVGCMRLTPAGYASGPSRTPPRPQEPAAAAEALFWPAKQARHAGAWTGHVYVLTDARTYSSAEMFAAEMQDNRIARLVGVRTGGDGCGFMSEAKPVTLTNSRLRFRIPNCVRLRADGTDEAAGVAPDLPSPPTSGTSDRARAARVLELAGRGD